MKTNTTTINWLHTSAIDWSLKESVRATMRSNVLRLLSRYPPDRDEDAIEFVQQQAEFITTGGPTGKMPHEFCAGYLLPAEFGVFCCKWPRCARNLSNLAVRGMT